MPAREVALSTEQGYNVLQEGNVARNLGRSEPASIRRYAERLRLLREIDRAILGAVSVEQTAAAGLEGLRQLVPCLRASVVLFDFDADEVILLSTRSDHPLQLQAGARAKLSQAFFFGDSPEAQPQIIEDLCNVSDEHSWIVALRAEGVRCYSCLPLVSQGRVIGALTFGLRQAGRPPDETLEIATDIANQLAVAIVNARLHEQVLRHAEDLEAQVAARTKALRVSEARFRAMFEAAPLGMVLTSPEGHVLQANSALMRMLEYAERDLQGMSLPVLGATYACRENLRAGFAKLRTDQDQAYRMDAPLRRKDGRTVWTVLTIARTRTASETPDLVVGMIEDVTEERQTRAALIQAERLAITGRLGASLAHEINNPLQSIIGCLGLAEELLPDGSEAGRFLDVGRTELRRVTHIVAQLRDLQRTTESDRLEAADLNDLLARLLTLNQPKCGELGVEVIWQPASRLPVAELMPDRIRQVFLNLILNALDAMPEGGKLFVRTARTRQPAGIRVTVRETGEGMSPAVLQRLFEPFYSTKQHGLGLGLFTSRSIIEQHGGTIKARSRPGRGTTIAVCLPVSPPGIA
jgi:PAS domain S-box-containing protein